MFRALITGIPFTRKSTLNNQEWNHLPRSILNDIMQFIHLERLFYPDKQQLYNIKPFIHIAKKTMHHSLESIPLPEYKPLNSKYCNSYLIDTFSRDLSVYNNPDNKILVSRNWIDYNQHYKHLKILSVQEVFDYHIECAAYMKYLHSARCIPDFNDKYHTQFLDKLQKLD
jgi:hypothetical protein